MKVREVAITSFWILGVVAGFSILANYDATPGVAGDPPGIWPAKSGLPRDPGLPTLVMLAHPRCPCTRASISELNGLMVRCRERVTVHVLFFDPGDRGTQWAETDLWRSAAAIPGVQVRRDVGGALARLFRISTSGHVLLYNAEHWLSFSGGITSARGHAGDNAGRSQITSIVVHGHGELGGRSESPVFGCDLTGRSCCKPPPTTQRRDG